MPKKRRALTVLEPVEPLIRELRGERVMLDSDLARIYGVPTKALNQAVKRNAERFPPDFLFRLTREDVEALNQSQIVTGSQKHRDPRLLPYAFTEHGAIMAANVLNSPRAVEMSIYVIRAFIKIRAALAGQADMARRLAEIEKTLIGHDAALRDLYNKIRPLLLPPEPKRREIGFHVKETGEAGTKGKTKR
jgi:ORF6N domain-containing protein